MRFLYILLFVSTRHFVFSQIKSEELTGFADDLYKTEWAAGINLHTKSRSLGGFFVKRNIRYKHLNYHRFSLDINDIHHSREPSGIRLYSGSLIIPNKHNYLVSFKPQYGREHILFRKARNKGVQVSVWYSGGPVIGFVAPYLIRVRNRFTDQLETVQLDVNNPVVTDRIESVVPVYGALFSSSLQIGGSLKVGTTLDFAAIGHNGMNIELGATLDAFFNEIVIVQGVDNSSFYPYAYITLSYNFKKRSVK